MRGEGDVEAAELIRGVHQRRVGFAPEPVVKRKGESPELLKLRASQERLARSVADGVRSGVEKALDTVDIERMWKGDGTDTLRKRADGYNEVELAAAYAKGRDVGLALVAALKRWTAATRAAGLTKRPFGAIADAESARDRLRDLTKATPEYRDDRRRVEAERFAEALAEPAPRTPFIPSPEPREPEPWQPHQGDADAGEGAAQLGALVGRALAGGGRARRGRGRARLDGVARADSRH